MKSISAIVALLLAHGAFAQITLTQSSYPSSVIGTDSLRKTTYASAFPSVAPAADGTWDMNVVTDTTPVYFSYRVPLTGYQFADSNTYFLSTYSYKGNVGKNISTASLGEFDLNIFQAGYSLFSVTGGATDSLIIASQNAIYSSSREMLAFPTTYHSSWISNYHYDVNFQISIAIASYSHAPGFVRRYTIEKDSVVGWGKMRVKNFSGTPAGYEDVLQVQTTIFTTDSFFLNGTPATATLLTSLGLTQGQKDTVYEQNYYRASEVTPLAKITFKDAAFTQPKKATTHVQRLPVSGLADVSAQQVNIYPNPVQACDLTLTLPQSGGQWEYNVVNTLGQAVVKGALKNSPTQKIALPTGTVPGTYYLQISHDGQQMCSKQFSVIR